MPKYQDRVGLVVGVPLSGFPLVPEFTPAYANLHPPMNFNVRHMWVNGSMTRKNPKPVDMARNEIVDYALQNDAEFIFFIDEDVTPPAHTLRQLVFQMRHHPDAAVIGGVYCHKAVPAEPMLFRGNGKGAYWDWKAGEFFEIDGCGMGCTLIRTEVFKDIEKPYFKTIKDSNAFLDGINKAEEWTEDLYFLDKVRKVDKWKIYADSSVIAEHWNPHTGMPTLLPPNSYPLRHISTPKGTKRILDVGCGEDKYECEEGETVTVDIREEVNPDYRCDIKSLPFATSSFDIVHSSHVLEHMDRDDIDTALDEWIRVLKPDGEFRLVVPNLEWAAKKVIEDKIDNRALNVMYGAQDNPYDFHKIGFTPKIIERMLKARGFRHMMFELIGYNICVKATRKDIKKRAAKSKRRHPAKSKRI